jgi:hypothetical protein
LDCKVCVDTLTVIRFKIKDAIRKKVVTLGKTNPQKETLNAILECRSPEYTASRAYKIHIVASDHRRKDIQIDISSTTVPVEEEFKKVLWDGNGNRLLIFWPIRSIA